MVINIEYAIVIFNLFSSSYIKTAIFSGILVLLLNLEDFIEQDLYILYTFSIS